MALPVGLIVVAQALVSLASAKVIPDWDDTPLSLSVPDAEIDERQLLLEFHPEAIWNQSNISLSERASTPLLKWREVVVDFVNITLGTYVRNESIVTDNAFAIGSSFFGAMVEVDPIQFVIDAIRSHPAVKTAEGVKSFKIAQSTTQQCGPSDKCSWGLDRLDSDSLTGEYTYEHTGDGVVVYVVDTGVYVSHPDFEGRAEHGTCFCGGAQYTPGNPECEGCGTDCNGHGTHVAGTVASHTYGVAKRATIVGIKVLECNGSATSMNTILAMQWIVADAIARGLHLSVLNLSLGGQYSEVMNNAVEAVMDYGVVPIVAAGNDEADTCLSSPGSSPQVLTVGSTNDEDWLSWFSNFGQCVDILAPGSRIVSLSNLDDSTTGVTMSGTSMATPHVSGVAAQVIERYGTAFSSSHHVVRYLFDVARNDYIHPRLGTIDKLLGTNATAAPAKSLTRLPDRPRMNEECQCSWCSESTVYGYGTVRIYRGSSFNYTYECPQGQTAYIGGFALQERQFRPALRGYVCSLEEGGHNCSSGVMATASFFPGYELEVSPVEVAAEGGVPCQEARETKYLESNTNRLMFLIECVGTSQTIGDICNVDFIADLACGPPGQQVEWEPHEGFYDFKVPDQVVGEVPEGEAQGDQPDEGTGVHVSGLLRAWVLIVTAFYFYL